MAKRAVALCNVDLVGGVATIVQSVQTFVSMSSVAFGGNFSVAVVPDAVTPHGTGAHAGATMAQGSSFAKAIGFMICRDADAATCGHVVAASGFVTIEE